MKNIMGYKEKLNEEKIHDDVVNRIYKEIKNNVGNVRATLNITFDHRTNDLNFNFRGHPMRIHFYNESVLFADITYKIFNFYIDDKNVKASRLSIRKLYNLLDSIRFDDIFEIEDDEQFEQDDDE